jgi:hypothetical protein
MWIIEIVPSHTIVRRVNGVPDNVRRRWRERQITSGHRSVIKYALSILRKQGKTKQNEPKTRKNYLHPFPYPLPRDIPLAGTKESCGEGNEGGRGKWRGEGGNWVVRYKFPIRIQRRPRQEWNGWNGEEIKLQAAPAQKRLCEWGRCGGWGPLKQQHGLCTRTLRIGNGPRLSWLQFI